MIQHIWSVLCQSASIDQQTNSVSLLNALESIVVLGEPDATHPVLVQAEIVSLWARENIDTPTIGMMRAYYIDPAGNQASEISLEINLTQSIFHRTRINIGGLLVTVKGEYNFRIEYQVSGEDKWMLGTVIPLLVMTQPLLQQN